MKVISKLVTLLCVIAIACTMIVLPVSASVSFPSISRNAYIEFKATVNVPVYTTPARARRGTSAPYREYNSYIETGDICKIFGFSENNSLLVSFPTSSGYKEGYIPASAVFPSGLPASQFRAKAGVKTYWNASGETYGSIDQNDIVYDLGSANGYRRTVYEARNGSRAWKLAYVSNSDYQKISSSAPANNYLPFGCFDIAESNETGKLKLQFWLIDRDTPGTAVKAHIYVGGPAGSGAWIKEVVANQYRPDVNNVFHLGNYHGYSGTITVPQSLWGRSVTVYLYGINTGGGQNPLIGTKTVTIRSNAPTPQQTIVYPMNNMYCTWDDKTDMSWLGYNPDSRRPERPYHLGIDVYGSSSTVYAMADGEVVTAHTKADNANGRYIVLRHSLRSESGQLVTVYSCYAHLSTVIVSEKEKVSAGQQIGVAGGSGYSDRYYGTHLHFAISDSSDALKYGYGSPSKGNTVTYDGRTYYNPMYVLLNKKLPTAD